MKGRLGHYTMMAVVAMAGCLGESATPLAEAPEATGMTFGARTYVGPETSPSAESFIAISPDGQHILTCMHGFFVEASPMFASVDGGRSFRRLPADPAFGIGGDCEVAIDGEGTWYFLDSLGYAATIHATEDEGQTWRHNYVSAIPTNGFADRPWLEAFGTTLILTYMPLTGIGGEPGGIGIVRSTDGGRTWSFPQTISFDASTLVVEGHPFAAPDGTLRIAILHFGRAIQTEPVQCRASFAVSRDDGVSWREEPVAEYECVDTWGIWANAASDGEGTLYWAYAAANGTATDVLVITSDDGGVNWSEPVPLLSTLGQVTNAWIDGRSDGRVDLAIVAAQDNQPSRLLVLRLAAHAPHIVEHVADLGENEFIEFMGLDHDANNRAHVAFTNADELLYVAEVA